MSGTAGPRWTTTGKRRPAPARCRRFRRSPGQPSTRARNPAQRCALSKALHPEEDCHVRPFHLHHRPRRPRALGRHPGREPPPGRAHRADRQRELHQPGRDGRRRARSSPTSTPRATPASATTAAASTSTWSSSWPSTAAKQLFGAELRQRAGQFGLAGQPGRVLRPAAAGRHHHGHEPGRRRPPHARHAAEHERQVVQGRQLRPGRPRGHRLRRHGAPGARAQAQAHHRRRQRLQPAHRLRALRPRGQGRGRDLHGRHGALRRPDRRRRLPQPGAACRRGDQHHAQEPARPARRHHPDERRGHRQEDQQRHLPRHPGRPADARHRRQGGGLQGGAAARVQGLPAAGGGQRPRAGRDADRARPAHRQRPHREPRDAGRPAPQGPDRQGSRGHAGPGAHDLQQERHPERPAEADGHQRHPPGHAGDDHARLQGRAGAPDRRT
jgi:hypothetical protein